MKLYHLPVPSDELGSTLITEHAHLIEESGGTLSLSRSFGNGPAVLVLTLPDEVTPEEVGLPDAQEIA